MCRKGRGTGHVLGYRVTIRWVGLMGTPRPSSQYPTVVIWQPGLRFGLRDERGVPSAPHKYDRILQHEESSGAAVPAMDEEESVPYVIPVRGRLIRQVVVEVSGL